MWGDATIWDDGQLDRVLPDARELAVPEPMDFSAWMEVFLEGEWHTFDPRNNVPRIGRIVVSRGRDATDIPLINTFGTHVLKVTGMDL
jgi:transglutaminase-like putative cysteine protease